MNTSWTFGATVTAADAAPTTAAAAAAETLAKGLAESRGSDPMHDSRRDSLRDSLFYAGLDNNCTMVTIVVRQLKKYEMDICIFLNNCLHLIHH